MPEIRFGVQDAVHSSRPVSAQQMINCWLSESVPGSRVQTFVTSSYGIVSAAEDIAYPKGAAVINGSLYVVDSNTLYRIDDANNVATLATVPTVGDKAIITGDNINILIITDDKGYIYNATSLTEIADEDFPVPAWMGFIDGYYPTIEKNSGKFYINTTAYNLTDWSATDFATAEGSPDDLLWGGVSKRELYLFGKESTEIWYNSGNADFPFSRTPNGFIPRGIMSQYAAETLDDVMYMMGDDGVAYMIDGYTLNRISNTFIERNVETYTKECRCLTWKEAGHPMVAFRFPEACHVYDVSTGLWHRRQSYGNGGTWDGKFALLAYNRWYIGGDSIGYLNQNTFTEYGDPMRWVCTSAAVNLGKHKVPHGLLELNFDVGHQGTVMLRYSDDGGYTWSKERTASLGAPGKYSTRVRFTALGAGRDRIYEVSMSDAYRRVLMNCYLNEYEK